MSKNFNLKREAMILAAGLGSRMRYKTKYIAKPLIKIRNKRLLEINLKKLKNTGINACTINTFYRKDTIKKFTRDYQYKNRLPKINLVIENDRLETGGGVKNAIRHFSNENILVVNGDSILVNSDLVCPVDLLFNSFDKSMDALLLLAPIKNCVGYNGKGDFVRENSKQVFLINRYNSSNTLPLVFTGWQILKSKIVKENKSQIFSLNNIYDSIKKNKRLYGVIHKGYFLHVSDPKSHFTVENFIKRNKIKLV